MYVCVQEDMLQFIYFINGDFICRDNVLLIVAGTKYEDSRMALSLLAHGGGCPLKRVILF